MYLPSEAARATRWPDSLGGRCASKRNEHKFNAWAPFKGWSSLEVKNFVRHRVYNRNISWVGTERKLDQWPMLRRGASPLILLEATVTGKLSGWTDHEVSNTDWTNVFSTNQNVNVKNFGDVRTETKSSACNILNSNKSMGLCVCSRVTRQAKTFISFRSILT